MFVDRINLRVKAGDGGGGCESYMHRTDRKTVPDGGDGGKGGSIILRADHNSPPLESFRFRQYIIAEGGGHGGSNRCRGRNGKDTEILVPVGTKILNREQNLLIRDLSAPGDQVVVVEGGEGGSGNFGCKASTPGKKGGTLDIELVLRLHADVFLVGLPNSGKSTLLNGLTGAHVKTQPYPFTTRSPGIGVCLLSDYERVTLCDLPSVYEGSDEGRGRGREFLAHLEHAKYILFVIDPLSDFAESLQQGLDLLRKQVSDYNPDFAAIPYGIIVNKMDLKEAQERCGKEGFRPDVPCFFISALAEDGISQLKDFFRTRFCAS